MDTKKEYFVIRFQHMRISDRLRNDLSETAINMGHPAISSLRKQGQTLWDEQSLTLKQNYEDLEKSIASLDKRIQSLQNQNAQLNSQLKKSKSEIDPPPVLNLSLQLKTTKTVR